MKLFSQRRLIPAEQRSQSQLPGATLTFHEILSMQTSKPPWEYPAQLGYKIAIVSI